MPRRVYKGQHSGSSGTEVLRDGTLAVDLTTNQLYIHDGTTPGGNLLNAGGGGADLSAVDQNYIPDTENTYDLGSLASNLRTGYFGTSVVIVDPESEYFDKSTLTYNGQHLAISTPIDAGGLYHSSYMSIVSGFGGLIYWQETGAAGSANSGFNGNGEMVWGSNQFTSIGPTYQLDKDQTNFQIGGFVTKAISGINLGATTTVAFDGDPYYANGPQTTITITGVVGTTELNNQTYYVLNEYGQFTLYTDPAFTTPLDSSSFTAYVSGGTAVIAPRATMSLPVLYSAPTTPKSGMMAVADGVGWDPTATAGETLVVYLGGAWKMIAKA